VNKDDQNRAYSLGYAYNSDTCFSEAGFSARVYLSCMSIGFRSPPPYTKFHAKYI